MPGRGVATTRRHGKGPRRGILNGTERRAGSPGGRGGDAAATLPQTGMGTDPSKRRQCPHPGGHHSIRLTRTNRRNPVFAAPSAPESHPASDPVTGFLPPSPPAPARPAQTRRDSATRRLGPTRATSTKRPAAYHPPRHPHTPSQAAVSAGRRAFGASRTCARSKLLAASDPLPDSRGRAPRHPTGPTSCPQSALARGAPWSAPTRAAYGQLCNPASLKPSQPPLRPPPPPHPPHRMHLRCTNTSHRV